MINICLCDDDSASVDYYKDVIMKSPIGKNINITDFRSGESLLFNAEEQLDEIDIIIIDIQMGELNGIDTVKALRKLGFTGEVIYLTTITDFVYESFETKAFHYLLKNPNCNNKFLEILKSAINLVKEKKNDYLLLQNPHKIKKILKSEIIYIESQGRKIYLYTNDGEIHEYYKKITDMVDEIDNKSFIRVHKSFIVNFEYVSGMDRQSVYLQDGMSLPMGRGYVTDVKDKLSVSLEKEEIAV